MKKWLLSYIVISKKERMGALALAVLISLVWVLPAWFREDEPDEGLVRLADQKMKIRAVEDSIRPERPRVYKIFDPNLAGDETWLNMGLTARNVQTIRRFQSRGGRFYAPEDLQRIYGINPGLIAEMIPYARVSITRRRSVFTTPKPSFTVQQYPARPPWWNSSGRKKEPVMVDVATADTAAFIALPGIGPTLARRIIQFREKCGGFHSIEQLAEVYGLQDTVFQLIRPRLTLSTATLRMLKVNQLGIDSLAMHPYITYTEARAIVQYRNQHGPFMDVEDLLKVALVSDEWLRKLRPYLQIH